MYHTTYTRASSAADAASKMAAAEDGKYLSGGQTLLPTMKARLAAPSDLIDLTHISGMKGIDFAGNTLTIGAATIHADVASSPDVAAAIPALAALAGNIGDPTVRNLGTIGGSIANNDPAADYPAACLGLGATIVTDRREIAADDFFTGMFETALDDGEIITSVRFPVPAKAGYAKFPNPASRYAIVGVMVAQTEGGARVAVTGAGEGGVFRHEGAEAALSGDFSEAALADMSTGEDGLMADLHASAAYRANLVTVMTTRATAKAG